MSHEKINPDSVFTLPGLTQVMVASGSRQVYISGQIPTGPDGALQHEGDLQAQIELALSNLVTCVDAAGATIDDVVKLNHYVVGFDENSLGPFIAALGAVFGDSMPEPTSTLVGVSALFMPGQLYEVDAIAVVD